MRFAAFFATALVILASSHAQVVDPEARKAEYVHAVTRGAGLMPWQEEGVTDAEHAFRADIEKRKDELLAHSGDVAHPVLYTREDLARARTNAESSEWAATWVQSQVALAEYMADQPADWVSSMLPMEAPAHGYGFTCPNCVGDKSQEATGHPLYRWSYREPDRIACKACEQIYPDPAFPETAALELPRLGMRVTYYLNEAERANPDNRAGELAWHWVGYPIHVSFTGIIREQKIQFMRGAAQSAAFAYAFTGNPRFAALARDILVRYAESYRQWPYRDYWDTYADCDPMYAAWHDKTLPIEWKRHLSEQAFANDTLEKAAMRQTYWGAGRVHPSTDAISGLTALALAYDLTCTARDADGQPLWSDAQRAQVERDLLLEYIMGAEPYVGGANKAENSNNKAPRIYTAMASIAKCLGIPAMADTALRGYEIVRDESFEYDGFSTESPSYNNMYLGQLLVVPEMLHGFVWPEGYARQGTVDYYATDPMLRLMYRGILWTLLPSGHYLPLSDTHVHTYPSSIISQYGLRRFPDLYEGTLPALGASTMSEYALFNLSEEALKKQSGLALPETYFPAWQTAIVRHGTEPQSATLTLAFNRAGGHRHLDNLAIHYEVHGRTLLGDHGYVGDMPINRWIRSTYSHNLVIVDGEEQAFGERVPELGFMAASPMATVVEAQSAVYNQCRDYRRRIVMLKGPEGRSVVVDIFRVAGGRHHAFRTYSEVAASDTEADSLTFSGCDMPAEPPLPEVGASLEHDDIFGLRDRRTATPQASWTATWADANGGYRLWMVSPCDRVEASNGPGQRSLDEAGRRVRYVDAIREGDNLESVFVAVHDPQAPGGGFTVTAVERVEVPGAGDGAVALRLSTVFGDYLVLNDFRNTAEAGGVRFQGQFALIEHAGGVARWMTVAADRFAVNYVVLADAQPTIAASVIEQTRTQLVLDNDALPEYAPDVQAYVRAKANGTWTGFPVDSINGAIVTVKDFPLPDVTDVELHAVGYGVAN